MSVRTAFLKTLTLCCALSLGAPFAVANDDEDDLPKFTIGSKAPALDIEHWVSDGDGKYEHVTELKSGTVYIVEFWATWCGPCIASMPHLAETQEKYAEKGVQLISVSDEDLDTVEKFLKTKVRGKDDMTYAELTKNYCLTADPDKSVMSDYFRAAGQRGIPCAFVVGKEGHVEWIGHPMERKEDKTNMLHSVIDQILADEWDREEFAVTYREQQLQQAQAMKAQRAIQSKLQEVQKLIGDDQAADAVKLLDELIADETFEPQKPMLEFRRSQILIMHVDGEEAVKALKELGERNKQNSQLLSVVTKSLWKKHQEKPLDMDMLEAAADVAELATQAAPEDAAILDTLARFVDAQGDLDRAIEIQEKAVEHATDSTADDAKQFLDELKAKKEKQGN